ncbi:uncharacterized protein PV09_01302 [Verruconis gallopava]|uniref:Ribosomal protein L9 domain-containing protein n=1 Tax=Verruconis gallopava TaxID=253628 RepID=A0A0D2BAN9_9PEZI|nr:uncharacterized protein PV09_01302 [Verruconis gallopava]KIW08389.1 hypothetical protein PV09_01302 [Verruconis gallopava]
MSCRVRPSFIPQCSACLRSFVEASWRPLHQQQVRGAKSSTTIPVQLLKDLDRFGRKGAFVAVPPGTMRNNWFPSNVARYATPEERLAIKRGEINVSRDYEFQVMAEASSWKHQTKSRPFESMVTGVNKPASTDIEIKTVEPNRAIALLDVLLPEVFTFERKPVPKGSGKNDSKSKLPASVQAMLKASIPETPTAIYGSVSTPDVAQYIREAVAYNDEAAQIQLSEANLRFVNPIEGDDATRIKHLGTYEVEISFKGADAPMVKKVVVKSPGQTSNQTAMDPSMEQALSPAGSEVVHRR